MSKSSRDKKLRMTIPNAHTATAAQVESGDRSSQTWIPTEGARGQQLLGAGDVVGATQVFQSMLDRLGDSQSFVRAVILGRLGLCSQLSGQSDRAIAQFNQA